MRPGKQVSAQQRWRRPPLPFVIRTDIEAVHIAMGEDRGMVEFIEKECSLGDWAMDSVQRRMEFCFADERDAIHFKLRFG
jgi:hypothetical protein